MSTQQMSGPKIAGQEISSGWEMSSGQEMSQSIIWS